MRTEPVDYDPDIRREDEDTRDKRWAEFVAWLRGGCNTARLWCEIVCSVGDWMLNERFHTPLPTDDPVAQRAAEFAETEGWSGVLSAIAMAMREDERARQELMDRR